MAEPPLWLDFANPEAQPFHRKLQETGGFMGGFYFPLHAPGAFLKLIGFMMARHSLCEYKNIATYLNREGGWTELLRPLKTAYSQSTENYADGGWWELLGTACKQQVFKVFRDLNKAYLTEKLVSGDVNVRNNSPFLLKLAEVFKLYIVWIERQDDGNVLPVCFHQGLQKNDPAFLVYFLEEQGQLCLLFHSQFHMPPEHGKHPHYIMFELTSPYLPEEYAPPPPSISRESSVDSRRILQDKLTAALMEIVQKTAANFGLPEAARTDLESLGDIVKQLQRLGDVQIDLEKAAAVAALVPNQKSLPRQHDLAQCKLFERPGEEMKQACHRFHTRCLKIYLSECHRQRQLPMCPICHMQLPQLFVEQVYPELARTIDLNKSQIIRASTTGNTPFSQSFTLETFRCDCGSSEIMWSNLHGRHTCKRCIHKQLLQGIQTCPKCGTQVTNEEVVTIIDTASSI